MNRFRLVVHVVIGLLAGVASAASPPVLSIPGAFFAGDQSRSESALRLAPDASARAVALGSPTATERGVLAKAATVPDKRAPLQIGYSRDVPSSLGQIDLASLNWRDMGDGSRVAHVTIDSPTASAVRAQLSLQGDPSGLLFRFTGSAAGASVFGPYTWSDIVKAGRWSPVMEGATATLEIEARPSVAVGGKSLTIPRVSHLEISGANLAPSRLKRVPNIGTAGSCNIDIACVQNPSTDLLNASASVAQIAFSTDGGTFLCSGSLLNSTNASGQPTQIPYFSTANHCVGAASEAATINFYWFFEAATCNSIAVPNFIVTAGGAALLYSSYDVDVTLVRMNNSPPAGVFMAGWDAAPVFPGTSVIALHHPEGDLKKYSAGQSVDYAHDFDDVQNPGNFVPQGSYLRIRWSQGTTEPGSSGSGVFTRADSGEYKMRGVLHGGDASCDTPLGLDYFSRFDLAYPSISQYLAGVTQPAAGDKSIEYYNVDLDHYFMTSFVEETASVETGGAGRGWVRTGYWFPIGSAEPGKASVCRFYGNAQIDPLTGQRRGPNSHFYTADAAECAQVKLDPGWVYEAIAFGIDVPVAGNCPAGSTPVFRAYNNGFATNNSNHRYTTNPTIYQFMLTQNWSGESTVMCAP